MALEQQLTTEDLRKRFPSQFDLVNYSIRLAENMIRSGREARVKTDNQNRSLQVIAEIAVGKDQFDEIAVEEVMVEEEIVTPLKEFKSMAEKKEKKGSSSKSKKGSKVLRDK